MNRTMIIIIIKELAKEFDGEFKCLEENTEKYRIFSVPITKEVKRTGKNREKNTKTIAQDLWQAYHQILLTILLQVFVKLNANMDMIIT